MPVQLDQADRLALGHQRQHAHALEAQQLELAALGGVGRRVRPVDEGRHLMLEDAARLGEVGQLVDLVAVGAGARRPETPRQDAVGLPLPEADGALVEGGGL